MRYLITLGLVAIVLMTHAQIALHLRVGYGSYNMGDMKTLQHNILQGFPAEGKITSAFPAYFYYEGGATFTLNQGFLGLNLGYGSTGGRVMYSDYSGQIISDQLLHYYAATAALGLHFVVDQKESWFIRGDLKPGFMITDLKVAQLEQVGSQSENYNNKFSATSFSLQPTIAVIKRMGRFGVDLEAGYFVNVKPGKLWLDGKKDYYLTGQNNEALYANWTGLRIGLGMCYFLR